jgi:hypothetical protein
MSTQSPPSISATSRPFTDVQVYEILKTTHTLARTSRHDHSTHPTIDSPPTESRSKPSADEFEQLTMPHRWTTTLANFHRHFEDIKREEDVSTVQERFDMDEKSCNILCAIGASMRTFRHAWKAEAEASAKPGGIFASMETQLEARWKSEPEFAQNAIDELYARLYGRGRDLADGKSQEKDNGSHDGSDCRANSAESRGMETGVATGSAEGACSGRATSVIRRKAWKFLTAVMKSRLRRDKLEKEGSA